MSERTARLGLPLLQSGQAQKALTHNEALHRLDRWLGRRFESRSAANPPAAPALDQAWIVPEGAVNAWAGHDGDVAEWDGADWVFIQPPSGTLGWIADEDALAVRGEGGWSGGLPVAGLSIGGRQVLAGTPAAIVPPAGGAVVDLEARESLSALLTNLRSLGLVS